MGKFIDLTGKKFGRLTVISRSENTKGNKRVYWNCICECEKDKVIVVDGYGLRRGTTTSCGCYHKEVMKNTFTTHGLRNHRLYDIHQVMNRRCFDENFSVYHHYGGRGISVCQEWKNDFVAFYNWSMKNGYESHLTIDRIDNSKGYSPDNCRWTTMKVQNNNKRSNRLITIHDETRNIKQWSEISGIHQTLIKWRLDNGWDEDDILRPPTKIESVEIDGKILTIDELSETYNISKSILRQRIKKGWTGEKLISPSMKKDEIMIEINGEEKTLTEWSNICGVSKNGITRRIQNGLTGEDLIKPSRKKNKTRKKGEI